ncbi:MAG TPA: DUF4007 family protein [Flavitalea sp.]|nr:DUF4007 family protein [Flavitalea sp.]HTF28830.1 DUF4007 family protein [Flavitalea sp.]
MAVKIAFSGHESFICKQFWLKKVFDFAESNKRFNEEAAVVNLGVGKNMVASLRYWGRAFGVLDDNDVVSPLAKFIFGRNGKDPFLEDFGTIWLLHYNLVKTNKASIYNFIFNEFRKERVDFTKDQVHGFLKRKCEEISSSTYNANTITTDINVFLRNYVKPHRDDKIDVEDDFSGIMIDLDIVKAYKQRTDQGMITRYKIEAQERRDLPVEIILYAILDNYNSQRSISFRELLTGFDSPGAIFTLTADSLYNKIELLTDKYEQIVYTETAGNQVVQIKGNLQKQTILNEYYQG